MFLYKGDVFIEELFLQSFVGGAHNGNLAGAYDRNQVGQAVMRWDHRSTSQVQMACRFDLDAAYWTCGNLTNCNNIAKAITFRSIIMQTLFVCAHFALQPKNLFLRYE